MANRFTEQARQQIGGVYNQHIQAAQQQIPRIQQLYETLTQGLEQAAQSQIQSGTQDILESASQRGVLRSTLPVDAQQELQSTIGQSLAEALGQQRLQQAQDVGAVRQRIGDIRTQRSQQIQSLADTLADRAFRREQMQLDRD